ncbi:MAG: glycosyltransferase family 2 protein [Phycisphaeraceae bacterium]
MQTVDALCSAFLVSGQTGRVPLVSQMTESSYPAVIDLVIPARNEAENIDALFDAIPKGVFRSVVLVDNGSKDTTAELARAQGAVVVREARPGYGAACQAGLNWIRTDQPSPPNMVAFLDADLADDPACLPILCDRITRGGADLVIGTRANRAEPGALDPHQRFGNWLACRLIGLATGRRFRDLGPMRVVRWRALQRLKMRDRTWGWTVEMQFKAARLGLQVVEVDVPYRKRRAGRSKISGSLIGSARAGVKIIATIAQLYWADRRGRLCVETETQS